MAASTRDWWDHPDELFTIIIDILRHLVPFADDELVPWSTHDLIVAESELATGPWRHLDRPIAPIAVPFSASGCLLDLLLLRLDAITCSRAARSPIDEARRWLDV